MRLIDADALFDELVKKQYSAQSMGILHTEYPNMMAIVSKQPIVDAVEVVRCENCEIGFKKFVNGKEVIECQRHQYDDPRQYKKLDDYCSYGERKEEC